MAIFDLFDMVGLAFDPPETKAKQIQKKVGDKIAELGSALGRETQQTRRDELQAQKDFLEAFKTRVLSPDGKKVIDPAYIRELAEKKVEAEKNALRAKVKLYAMAGRHTVTAAAIREQKKETKLSTDHVKEIYLEAGFEIVEMDVLSAYPKFPANVDRIHAELAALRNTKDPNPNGADTSVAVDLYAFAAYLENDTGSIPLYRSMDRDKLFSLFSTSSMKFSQRNDNLGKLCGSLSAAAKRCVFDTDENRQAYDLYLVYCAPELTDLFTTLKKCKKTELETEEFAEPCISIISKYFPDYKVALAIYNKEGNCEYLPQNSHYTIKCNYCDEVSEFECEADAIKTNACKNCRKPLFKKCDKCGKPIPEFKESCPHCGYVFASAAMFSKLYQQAEAAFRRSDFDAARQYLFQAQSAAPGEKSRIDSLAKQIEREEAILKEPINKLRQLIAERKFYTARTELGTIIRKYPNLNTTEFNQIITGELAKADAMFVSASSYSASKKADVCITILMQCADYQPALAFLHANQPMPCSRMTVTPVSASGVVNISWSHSTEQGVTYRLVRKRGKIPAASENDGTVLVDNTTSTSFTDEQIQSGQEYTYSVFVSRLGVCSSPVSKSCTLYADVKNCRIYQRGSCVRITWDPPENSRGATVIRVCEGKSETLSINAHGSYEDTSTEFGKTYIYRICANYDGTACHSGVECVITRLPSVDAFTIRAVHVKDSIFKINWTIRERGINLRIMVNGQMAAEAKSDEKETLVDLPKETFCRIGVLAYSEGKWINSENSVEVNTYTSCKIDKKATRLEETMISGRNGVSYRIDMKICLQNRISPSVTAFYYAVRTAKSENRWASTEEIGKSSDIQRISLNNYKKQGFIPFQDFVLNETTFFVTVFTCHSAGGKEIVAEPQKLKVERPLNANLFWAVSHGMFDGLKLSIEMSGNKAIEYVPELFLCACDADQFLSSPDDKNARIIMKIPSMDLDVPTTEYKTSIPVKTTLPSRYLKKCKYFLFVQDTSDEDSIILRWQRGFLGKV